MKKLFSQNRE